ncbi:uncharacterized protein METZ01_LOCUS38897 [marine metagenome]|uniref:Uncharacterized protein n=1 Tax=marine metagenome TaxID=408172 RepID=A0A381R993_9ZZZZ
MGMARIVAMGGDGIGPEAVIVPNGGP